MADSPTLSNIHTKRVSFFCLWYSIKSWSLLMLILYITQACSRVGSHCIISNICISWYVGLCPRVNCLKWAVGIKLNFNLCILIFTGYVLPLTAKVHDNLYRHIQSSSIIAYVKALDFLCTVFS